MLLDGQQDRLIWSALRNFSRALRGPEMDSGTRRTGAVIHVVAVVQLEALGEADPDGNRRRLDLVERKALASKPYLPSALARILSMREVGLTEQKSNRPGPNGGAK